MMNCIISFCFNFVQKFFFCNYILIKFGYKSQPYSSYFKSFYCVYLVNIVYNYNEHVHFPKPLFIKILTKITKKNNVCKLFLYGA
jgi:hypothetical protein